MKLEENMYVRTESGRIAKIEYIEEDTAYFDDWLYQSYEEYIDFINLKDEKDVEDIIKASFNIIDVLECGDYVNGHEVKSKQSGVKRIDIGEDENYVWLYEKDIKSIVTHEQMEQMSYRLGK